MAVSEFDKLFLNDNQLSKLKTLTEQWERAHQNGDREGMQSAHLAAEAIRAGQSYSGGGDGSGYVGLYSGGGYTPSVMPYYKAQTDAVGNAYDAARDVSLAGLKSAYELNNAALQAQREEIPKYYNGAANSAAAESEKDKLAFGEYAAASGLNSGAGGQAELSRQNVLQSDISAIRRAEADAQSELENEIARLKLQYQNAVAETSAKNAYEKAAALLEEYRAQEKSSVSAASEQADENYRAFAAQRDAYDEAWDRNGDRAQNYAATLAKYGNYSGYTALGYTAEEISMMETAWNAQNPRLAYAMGRITPEEYYRFTGKWPEM